jgi:uncharacterized protein affecting Mg2+/Co2+ transport
VVGQLPRAGLRFTPHDSGETLSISFNGLKVSGLIVHEVSSYYNLTSGEGNDLGLHSSLAGVGFRVHTDRLEVAADDCVCYLACRCAPARPLPEWSPMIVVSRDDWNQLRALAFAPELGINVGVQGAGIVLTVRTTKPGTGMGYPPSLRLPQLTISLPSHGLAVSAFQELLPGALSVQADLQPFVQALLFFLSDVLLPAVSNGITGAVHRRSDAWASSAHKELLRLRDAVRVLPEPSPPYPIARTVRWTNFELLQTLNEQTAPGSVGFLPLTRLAVSCLLKEGRFSLPDLGQFDVMHRLPSLWYQKAVLAIEPAALSVDGLDTLSELRLFQPVTGEPFSLAFGAGLGRLDVTVRLNLSLSLPRVNASHLSQSEADELDQGTLFYHATDTPLRQQIKLTLALENISASALVFAPLSRLELDRNNWLLLPPTCLLRPLRDFFLRQLRLWVVPVQLLVESDNHDQAYRHELEAHLYQLASDVVGYFRESYLSRHDPMTPEVIDLLVGGVVMRSANELLQTTVADLTEGCDLLTPRQTSSPQPVEWCRAPLVTLVAQELTLEISKALLVAFGLADAHFSGDLLSVGLDGVWLGPVHIAISDLRLLSIDTLFALQALQSDCDHPHELRNTIGLGETGSPLRVAFVLRVQLGCQNGHGCEWHSYNVSLTLASLLVHLDLSVELLQPFELPSTVNESLACAVLPLRDVRLLKSTRIEVDDWSSAILELEVHAQGQPASAIVPTTWVYWLVTSLLPGGLQLGNDLIAAKLAAVREACASRRHKGAHAEAEDKETAKALILVAIYGTVVLVSGAIIGAHCCCRKPRMHFKSERPMPQTSLGAEQPLWQAVLMTVLCVAVMVMFVISQATGSLGNLFIHVSVAGDPLPVINGFNITVADTVLEIWCAPAAATACPPGHNRSKLCRRITSVSHKHNRSKLCRRKVSVSHKHNRSKRTRRNLSVGHNPSLRPRLDRRSSGSPPLAMLVGGMSGTWPYVKMTVALFALWAPPTVLPVGRRGAYLFFIDAFGKWSFFDVLLVHLLMSGFKLGFDVPAASEVPADECGTQLPLIGIQSEVAPLEKVNSPSCKSVSRFARRRHAASLKRQ